MASKYLITLEGTSKIDGFSDEFVLDIDENIHLEKVPIIDKTVDQFGYSKESNDFWDHLKKEFRLLIKPISSGIGMIRFFTMAAVVTFTKIPLLKYLLFLLSWVIGPILRGWRLQVVNNVGLNKEIQSPSLGIDRIVKYFKKGFVLMVMRYIYFLPMIVVALLSSQKLFGIGKELLIYVYNRMMNVDQMGIAEFMVVKVIPELGMEMLIQIVVLGFYIVFIWPIYRVTMLRYAFGLIRGWQFLSYTSLKKSIALFRRNAASIYGIYAFTVAVDALAIFTGYIVDSISLGLLFLIMPTYYFFFTYWVKGYAYGHLANELFEKEEIVLDDRNYSSKQENYV